MVIGSVYKQLCFTDNTRGPWAKKDHGVPSTGITRLLGGEGWLLRGGVSCCNFCLQLSTLGSLLESCKTPTTLLSLFRLTVRVSCQLASWMEVLMLGTPEEDLPLNHRALERSPTDLMVSLPLLFCK